MLTHPIPDPPLPPLLQLSNAMGAWRRCRGVLLHMSCMMIVSMNLAGRGNESPMIPVMLCIRRYGDVVARASGRTHPIAEQDIVVSY